MQSATTLRRGGKHGWAIYWLEWRLSHSELRSSTALTMDDVQDIFVEHVPPSVKHVFGGVCTVCVLCIYRILCKSLAKQSKYLFRTKCGNRSRPIYGPEISSCAWLVIYIISGKYTVHTQYTPRRKHVWRTMFLDKNVKLIHCQRR